MHEGDDRNDAPGFQSGLQAVPIALIAGIKVNQFRPPLTGVAKGFGFMSDNVLRKGALVHEPFDKQRESHSGNAGMRSYYLPAVVKLLDVHRAISHHRLL